QWPAAGKKLLLDALLFLHPALDGYAHRVRDRENLVGPEADDPIGAYSAQLPVDLLDGDPGAERQADQPPHRLYIGHQGPAGLAQRHEHLEGLPLVILGDGDVERAERRLYPAGGAAQDL